MQHVTPTSAIVRVEVDPPAPVTLEVGLSAAVGSTDAGSGSVIESREVRSAAHHPRQGARAGDALLLHRARARGAEVRRDHHRAAPTTAVRRFASSSTATTARDDAAHAAVVRAMVAAASDFLVNTGDFVENGASAAQWQTFFDIEAPLTRERPLFSCVGNHELVDGAGIEYVRYFGPAELPMVVVAPVPTITGAPAADAGARAALARSAERYVSLVERALLPGQRHGRYTSGATREWLEKVLDRRRTRSRASCGASSSCITVRGRADRTARTRCCTTRTSLGSSARTRSIS